MPYSTGMAHLAQSLALIPPPFPAAAAAAVVAASIIVAGACEGQPRPEMTGVFAPAAAVGAAALAAAGV